MMTTRSFELSPLLQAAAITEGGPVTGDLRWLHACADELAGLCATDLELIEVVTGERLGAPGDDRPDPDGRLVSFFALQILLDRVTGALPAGEDVSIGYVEAVFSAYDGGCPEGNPFSGDLFDLALAYLVGRDLARLGPERLVF